MLIGLLVLISSLDRAILTTPGALVNGPDWRRLNLHPGSATVFHDVKVPADFEWERVGLAERATWEGLLAEGIALDTRVRLLLEQRDLLADHMHAFLEDFREAVRDHSDGAPATDDEIEEDLRELEAEAEEAEDASGSEEEGD